MKKQHARAGDAAASRWSRRSNGTALGGGWEIALLRALPHRARRPVDPARPARSHAGPAARRGRRHQDGAPARPAGGAAVPGRRQDDAAAGGGEAGPRRRGWPRTARTLFSDGARVDRGQPGAEAALGRRELPHARRRRPPARRCRRCCRWRPAMLVEKTRGLYPAPEGDHVGAGRRRATSTSTRRMRIESRYLAQPGGRAGGEEPDLALFQPHRDQVRRLAARRTCPKWKATKVGILGAGMMGGGIAYANAVRGVACVLKDVSLEAAEKGKGYTRKGPGPQRRSRREQSAGPDQSHRRRQGPRRAAT